MGFHCTNPTGPRRGTCTPGFELMRLASLLLDHTWINWTTGIRTRTLPFKRRMRYHYAIDQWFLWESNPVLLCVGQASYPTDSRTICRANVGIGDGRGFTYRPFSEGNQYPSGSTSAPSGNRTRPTTLATWHATTTSQTQSTERVLPSHQKFGRLRSYC